MSSCARASTVAPGPGFSAACHEVTGGNPQLIRELLAALAAEGVEPTASGAELVVELRADRIAASILARVGRVGDAGSLARPGRGRAWGATRRSSWPPRSRA